MRKYVPLALEKIELGKHLPVDVWDANGKLLARQGQAVMSEQHKEVLRAHQACITEADAKAWQKSYDRMIHTMLKNGMNLEVIARAGMPSEISESDYIEAQEVAGGWLDLQEVLRGLLYQGEAAINPQQRLVGIEAKALALLNSDPDESLFILFQALADDSLGYCATHALLSAVVCELTATRLGMAEMDRRVLFRSALVMNIGMARAQDTLATQGAVPDDVQQKLIRTHSQKSLEILQHFGVIDEDHLDIVRWHHAADDASGLPKNLESRRILRTADSFIAKMAARKTRLAMSPLGAAKSLLQDPGQEAMKLGSAMATSVGFYPPGTYVQLINGEKAVSITRGLQANYPHVVSIVSPAGVPLSKYSYRNTTEPKFAIQAPITADKIKVKVSLEKVVRAKTEHPT